MISVLPINISKEECMVIENLTIFTAVSKVNLIAVTRVE